MSNFRYITIGNDLYLSIGKERILVRWKERWVPLEETIEGGGGEIDPENESIDLGDNDLINLEENIFTIEQNSAIDAESHILYI